MMSETTTKSKLYVKISKSKIYMYGRGLGSPERH